MTLTREENELLTRVGPGTPCGELMRRYWQPVGMPPELTDSSPTKFVRILGEDLVLFCDRSGRVGLLVDHCSHRGASLLYGRVEERGIACTYHGWLYDTEGNCLETPAEPADSLFHLTIKHRAYPIREYCGLYWAYLGPPPAPFLPRYDLTEVGPVKAVGEVPRLDCNWLQIVENTIDQAHIFILHQNFPRPGQRTSVTSTTRGAIDELERLEYVEAPFGIKRRQVHKSGYDEIDLIAFPTTQRIYNQYIVKVPIDDTHTREYHVVADPMLGRPSEGRGGWNPSHNRFGSRQSFGGKLVSDGDGSSSESSAMSISYLQSSASAGENGSNRGIEYYFESSQEAKSPPDAIYPHATYRMDKLRFQDFTIMESQGTISARENQRVAISDGGVVLFREILKREIEKVRQGLDPIGVIRDPANDFVDTYVHSYMEMVKRFPPSSTRR